MHEAPTLTNLAMKDATGATVDSATVVVEQACGGEHEASHRKQHVRDTTMIGSFEVMYSEPYFYLQGLNIPRLTGSSLM